VDEMHNQHAEFLKAMESARQEAMVRELKQCTFKPKLSKSSAKLAQRHRERQMADLGAFALTGPGGSPRSPAAVAAGALPAKDGASPAPSLAPGSPLGSASPAGRLLATAKVAKGVGSALAAGYTESFGDTLYRQLESDLRDALTGSKVGAMDAALESLRVEDDSESPRSSNGSSDEAPSAKVGRQGAEDDPERTSTEGEEEDDDEPTYDEEEAVRRALGRADAAQRPGSPTGEATDKASRVSDLLEAELQQINQTMVSPTKSAQPPAVL